MNEAFETLLPLLLREYGPLLGPTALRQALGYRSRGALNQAMVRGTVPIPLFALPGRNGRFALTYDLAKWLATLAHAGPGPPA